MNCKYTLSLSLVLLLTNWVNIVMSILVMGSEKYPLASKSGKICIGTTGRMSVPSNREHHYQNLRDRYSNCTYVDGNLELTWIENKDLDLTFLQNIREVTGYVLISHVDVKRIVLPNLQIIRGRSLFKLSVREDEFALMVTLSKMENLEMPALRDILAGSVGFFNNYNLCHIRTINWEEILTGPKAKTIYVYDFKQPERDCPACDSSCEDGCWGEGVHNCQKYSKINCSPQCHQGRCFGSNPRECCHLFCAGGCTGPKQSDCLACRNFYDDGVCKEECPPMMKYNPSTYSWQINPEGKYAYGATCVKNCPDHLLKDNGACVRSCPPNKKNNNKGECVPCDGPCPKNCQGVEIVHSGNIDSFKDCTIIEGSLTILETTFNGFQDFYPNLTFGPKFEKMHPSKLEIFSTLKQITGYLSIQASHPDFQNLSYFRNLEEIGGRQSTEYFSAIYIVKTSLVSLNLRGLTKIRAGTVVLLENKDLCFADTVDWNKIRNASSSTSANQNNLISKNGNETMCRRKGLVCHPQCSSDGCWGPGPDECLSCKAYKLGDTCIENCNTSKGIYDDGNKICKQCHEECLGQCRGAGPRNCTACRHVRDGSLCVADCSIFKYNDNGECKPCHENCIGGCSGPNNTLGEGGCNSCEKAIVSMYNPNVVEQCLKVDETCPDGYYHEFIGPQEEGLLKSLTGKSVCRKCHSRCKNCTSYGIHQSVCECFRYLSGEQCEDECPRDHYADETNHKCVKCAEECRGCTGPTISHCISCRNYRVYNDATEQSTFNCTAVCPSSKPYKVFDGNSEFPYCSDKDPSITSSLNEGEDQITTIVCIIVICLFISGTVVAMFGAFWLRKARKKVNTLKMTMTMTNGFEEEPTNPSDTLPNISKLRIIRENELRRGSMIGCGAFGAVYKGVWIPEGENIKIPVAIKVLRNGQDPLKNKEFLEEAYIMASVNHKNILQLIAVCMTSELMLITALMPLGCLHDYVRKNKSKIGSKPLLNWCTQIARGMAYLEKRRMVHRDLALRNVLLQNPGLIKITDFGLSKFLDSNEEFYRAEAGKVPIKWLAPECIQQRIFTHKSDVWAFGVTVWELLTFGEKPYEDIDHKQILGELMLGNRLQQPPICTIDVFKVILGCWYEQAEARPTFQDIAETFARFASDPNRYLVIEGDKFLRLPHYSKEQEQDGLIDDPSLRSVGPETVMDAEEYLRPRNLNEPETPPPPTPIKKFMDERGFDGDPITVYNYDGVDHTANGHTHSSLHQPSSHSSHFHHNTGHQSLISGGPSTSSNVLSNSFNGSQLPSTYYSQNHSNSFVYDYDAPRYHFDGNVMFYPKYPGIGGTSTTSGGHVRESSLISSNSRYCTDEQRDSFMHKDIDQGAQMRLPVDDDEYLIPSGHLPQQPAYMDLIGNGSIQGHTKDRVNYMTGFLPKSNAVDHRFDNLEYHLMARDPEYVNSVGKGLTPHPPSTPVHLTQYSSPPPPLTLNTLSSINASSTGSTNSATSSTSSTNCPAMHNGTPSSPTVLLPPGQMGTQVIHIIHSNINKSNRPSASDVDDTMDDHDYYNDDYVLQREMQPLTHRTLNETTV